ncbi:MAG TPA: carboxypeptidase regulatory-like domain-containing protein [Acidobacteriaceae bacterium]|nr:carboxypeptidase regulatory-like domain-containing protein [Acidobacteriaceae bacterium]
MRRKGFIAVLLLLVCGSIAWAQFETSAVLGFVRDSSGASIPNSKVTLVNISTGTSVVTTTDNDGHFQFADVQVGRYKVTAAAPGFSDSVTDPFAVNVNTRQRVDLTLKPGSVSETVVVSGAASQLETETSSTGTMISETQVHDLPLNGRAYGDLMSLAPGVRRNNLENQTVTSRDASFNVNGQRSEFNNFLLDGLDNNAYGTSNQGFSNQAIPPSPDAINQFRVETNNYSAEFGRASGAVVNVSINSGTNQVHGKLWEYHRNTILNAIGPFSPPTNKLTGKAQKPELVRNQFGGAIGGPIHRDRLFYFADYEGNRQVQAQYSAATVPTDLQRKGIFQTTTGAPVPLRNPITGTVYANGIVPQADWNPLAIAVINALPSPNVSGFANNYVSFPRATLTDNKGDGRLDYIWSSKTTLFGRYSDHKGEIVDATTIPGDAGDGGNGTIHAYNRQIAAGVTHAFGPRATLDARLGFTWTHGGKTPYLAGQESLNAQAGVPGLPTDKTVVRRLSNESVKNFSTWGAQTSNPQFQNPFVINPKINYSLINGHHSMKFGWEYLSINTEVDDFNPVYGGETFSQGFSQNGGGTSDAGAAAAAYLTDFLTGARDSYQLNNFRIVNYHQRMDYFYVQDDWKFLPSLTVNAGLRYELVTPQFVDGNHLANFDPSTNTLIQASNGSLYQRALVNTPKLDFAPRFGISWQLNPKTVVRSAYGISFDQFNREGGENLLAYNGPYIINSTVNQVPPFAFTGTKQPLCTGDNYTNCFRTVMQGYPSNFVAASNFNTLIAQTRYIPKDIPTGYVESWHLDVQREVGHNSVLTVSYIGEHGVHIWVLADLNQAVANTPTGTLSVQARRPIKTFTTIEESIPAGFLHYSGLQAKFEHRYSGGVYLLNSFTWSHAIDNASGHLDTPNGDNSRVNLANLPGERGQSAYNQPINETLSVVWDLPFGEGRLLASQMPKALETVLGGWQITAINTDTSGQPFNLTYSPSAAFQLSPLLTQRPNSSGNPVNPKSSWVKTASALNGYLSATAVTLPSDPSHAYGTAGRNSVRDMTFNQFDLGLHKSFRLWNEHTSFDLRGEAFNVLNKVNYMAPNSNRSSGSFGSITSYFPPRQLQVAGKFTF